MSDFWTAVSRALSKDTCASMLNFHPLGSWNSEEMSGLQGTTI